MPEQAQHRHRWRSVDTHVGANGSTWVLQQCSECLDHRDVNLYDLVDSDGRPKDNEQVQIEEARERGVEL